MVGELTGVRSAPEVDMRAGTAGGVAASGAGVEFPAAA
jgi:hypothetical protein